MKVYKSTCIVYHPDCIKEQRDEVSTIKELNQLISKCKINYARIMPAINEAGAEDMNGIMIDYGLWNEFLYVDGITFNDYIKEERKNEA